MKPKLLPQAGRMYQAAVLLLAPSISALSQDEFEALIELVRESTGSSLVNCYKDFATANAVMATSVLQTRFSAEPGMSEASEVTFVASMYLDNNKIMPPQNAKYENSWVEKFFPEVSSLIDSIGDVAQSVLLAEDPSLSSAMPPSLLQSESPMFVRSLFDVIDNSFKSSDAGMNISNGERVAPEKDGSNSGADLIDGVFKMLS